MSYYLLLFPDAPSINRVLPVVTPNNLYISSRGRVVFGLLTVDKYTKDMEEYLSDEFRQFIAGKQVKFTESDIEKVSKWQMANKYCEYIFYKSHLTNDLFFTTKTISF